MTRHAFDGRIVAAREIADRRPLDLDDARPEIRQLSGRERRGDRLLDGNHGDSFQRQHQRKRLVIICMAVTRMYRNLCEDCPDMTEPTRATGAVVDFIASTSFSDIPSDALTIGRRCVADGVAVILAGSTTRASEILRAQVREDASRAESTILGRDSFQTRAASAALVNATSGHAHDYDDTQLSTAADRIFGLLTHPTIPPLTASLAVGERLGVSGRAMLEAFLVGFEAECKIADA